MYVETRKLWKQQLKRYTHGIFKLTIATESTYTYIYTLYFGNNVAFRIQRKPVFYSLNLVEKRYTYYTMSTNTVSRAGGYLNTKMTLGMTKLLLFIYNLQFDQIDDAEILLCTHR